MAAPLPPEKSPPESGPDDIAFERLPKQPRYDTEEISADHSSDADASSNADDPGDAFDQDASEEKLEEAGSLEASRFIFATAIFLSAFLLFQVELIIGKFILPWFGGSAAVWSTALAFFQTALLAGYALSHLSTRRLAHRSQGAAQLAFTAFAIATTVFAIWDWGSALLPGHAWKPSPAAPIIPGVLLLLSVAVGIPFLLLASVSPLLQSWYARIHADSSPYWLFALSNLGSLIGLLSYPLLFERYFTLHTQSHIWTGLFFFDALCIVACSLRSMKSAASTPADTSSDVGTSPPTTHELTATPAMVNEDAFPLASDSSHKETLRAYALPVFLLAACASALMLSATNLITQDIAPVPLLWTLPLAAYILSFVLTFQAPWFYLRRIFHAIAALAITIGILALYQGTSLPVPRQVAAFTLVLLVLCIVCHGEAARLRPSSRAITGFYLALAAGGAAGTVLIAFVVPFVLRGYWEFQFSIIAFMALLLWLLLRDSGSWMHRAAPALPPALLALVLFGVRYVTPLGLTLIEHRAEFPIELLALTALLVAVWTLFAGAPRFLEHRRVPVISSAIFIAIASGALVHQAFSTGGKVLARYRNAYGGLLVREMDAADPTQDRYELLHGRILHGSQLRDPARRDLPTTYYGAESGVGLAITAMQRRMPAMRVGVIGLGSGTLAAYARPGDVYRFYDLNPQVVRIAMGDRGFFSYIKDAKGTIRLTQGDARLNLEREAHDRQWQDFDVLALDAFSGDAIPVHLLTKEAMELYIQNLRGPDSIIAVHISNYAVDLEPVVAGLARHFNMNALLIDTPGRNDVFPTSEWILLCRGGSLRDPRLRSAGFEMLRFSDREMDGLPQPPLWTDEKNNLLDLLK